MNLRPLVRSLSLSHPFSLIAPHLLSIYKAVMDSGQSSDKQPHKMRFSPRVCG